MRGGKKGERDWEVEERDGRGKGNGEGSGRWRCFRCGEMGSRRDQIKTKGGDIEMRLG